MSSMVLNGAPGRLLSAEIIVLHMMKIPLVHAKGICLHACTVHLSVLVWVFENIVTPLKATLINL